MKFIKQLANDVPVPVPLHPILL